MNRLFSTFDKSSNCFADKVADEKVLSNFILTLRTFIFEFQDQEEKTSNDIIL
jgi:hypothetical protein